MWTCIISYDLAEDGVRTPFLVWLEKEFKCIFVCESTYALRKRSQSEGDTSPDDTRDIIDRVCNYLAQVKRKTPSLFGKKDVVRIIFSELETHEVGVVSLIYKGKIAKRCTSNS